MEFQTHCNFQNSLINLEIYAKIGPYGVREIFPSVRLTLMVFLHLEILQQTHNLGIDNKIDDNHILELIRVWQNDVNVDPQAILWILMRIVYPFTQLLHTLIKHTLI